MNAKDAIEAAKTYVRELYGDSESVSELSLEEVEFDTSSDQWLITIEFSRPVKTGFRTRARELLAAAGGTLGDGALAPRRRVQKVVIVSDAQGRAVAMKNREAA